MRIATARDAGRARHATAASRPPRRRSVARLVERGHEVVVYCRNPGQVLDRVPGHDAGEPPGRAPPRRRDAVPHRSVGRARDRCASVRTWPSCSTRPTRPSCRPLRAAGIPVAVHVDGLEWKRAKWGRRGLGLLPLGGGPQRAVGRRDHRRRAGDRRPPAATRTACRALHLLRRADRLARRRRLVDAGAARRASYHLVVARFEPENHVREIVAGYVARSCPAAAAGGRRRRLCRRVPD